MAALRSSIINSANVLMPLLCPELKDGASTSLARRVKYDTETGCSKKG